MGNCIGPPPPAHASASSRYGAASSGPPSAQMLVREPERDQISSYCTWVTPCYNSIDEARTLLRSAAGDIGATESAVKHEFVTRAPGQAKGVAFLEMQLIDHLGTAHSDQPPLSALAVKVVDGRSQEAAFRYAASIANIFSNRLKLTANRNQRADKKTIHMVSEDLLNPPQVRFDQLDQSAGRSVGSYSHYCGDITITGLYHTLS